MCLRNKSHLNTLKLSVRYLSTYLCVWTRGRTKRKIIFLSHTLNIRESDTASLVEFRVSKHIYNHFRENSIIITSFQSGFTPGDSTVNQLIYLYNTFCQALDSGKEVCVVFCDIKRAFDRVWHAGLIHKLKVAGISGSVLRVVPVLVLLFVALWFILRGDLFYALPCVILFLCFSVLLALRLPRLGKRVLYVCLICACLDLSVSSFSWCLGRAAVCDCGTPWTFLLHFKQVCLNSA